MMTKLILKIFFVVIRLSTAESNQPDSLLCYATLAPQEQIICPQDRMNFCVKEFVDSSRRECGRKDTYPYDVWDAKEPGGLCVYRKCASSCPNETITYEGRDGVINSRSSVCCSSNLCNSGYSYRSSILIGLITFSVFVLLLID